MAGSVVAFVVGTSPASADRGEASLHAHAVGGLATVGDQATSQSATAPLGGVAVRASYATRNLWQYDAELTFATTGKASLAGGSFKLGAEPRMDIPFELTTRLVRFDVGTTFRFGVRVIPTLRLAVGIEERFRSEPVLYVDGRPLRGTTGRHGDHATDVAAVGAFGLDYRINRRLIAGASAGVSVAVPVAGPSWRTFELSAHVAYYWYPLWFE